MMELPPVGPSCTGLFEKDLNKTSSSANILCSWLINQLGAGYLVNSLWPAEDVGRKKSYIKAIYI